MNGNTKIMVRFITKQYNNGAKQTFQWDPIMDGVWKYGTHCKEVIFIMDEPYEWGITDGESTK